jgi:hypothetical protein
MTPCSESKGWTQEEESNVMSSLTHGYTKVMACSADLVNSLSSPAAALAGKFLSLLWAFQMQG